MIFYTHCVQRFISHDSPILASSSVRDLGLLTDSSLKFELHINQKIALSLLRAKQLLKSFRSSNPAFYSALFKTYVLPTTNGAKEHQCFRPPSPCHVCRTLAVSTSIAHRPFSGVCQIAKAVGIPVLHQHHVEFFNKYNEAKAEQNKEAWKRGALHSKTN
uniref:Uncharacterized protein n=1 Tax=Caenorhabditis japonica TaxID=281687 RepID=A0A8R1EPQ0_CAEJA